MALMERVLFGPQRPSFAAQGLTCIARPHGPDRRSPRPASHISSHYISCMHSKIPRTPATKSVNLSGDEIGQGSQRWKLSRDLSAVMRIIMYKR